VRERADTGKTEWSRAGARLMMPGKAGDPVEYERKEKAMTRLMTWRPFREMDEFFGAFAPTFPRFPMLFRDPDAPWTPVADVIETDKEFLIKMELPEVKREDVQVFAEGDFLKVKGERKEEREIKEEKFHVTEALYGKFERAFELPQYVDMKQIKAECRDGVLRVHLPKLPVEAAKPLRITIQ
jgi:HSP20 family protein